jgi:RNA polymerase sigma-70 factor (ECF subfamily)
MLKGELEKYFDSIYDETYSGVLKFVVAKCGNIHDVSDLMQKIYLEVFNYIRTNRQIENNNAFLREIAKRQLYKYYSRKSKVVEIITDDETMDRIPEETFEEEILEEFPNSEIWELIKKEELIIQKVLTLHFLNGNTIKEISEELGINESTIKSKLYRALQKIKKELVGG